jgi:hypothetical protein
MDYIVGVCGLKKGYLDWRIDASHMDFLPKKTMLLMIGIINSITANVHKKTGIQIK